MRVFNIVTGVWAFVIKQMQFNMHFFLHLPRAGYVYQSIKLSIKHTMDNTHLFTNNFIRF